MNPLTGTVPGVVARTCTTAEAPGAKVPNEHTTGLVPGPVGQLVGVGPSALTNVGTGSVSVTCTPFATTVSLFVTVTVYCTSLPAVTGSGASVMAVFKLNACAVMMRR